MAYDDWSGYTPDNIDYAGLSQGIDNYMGDRGDTSYSLTHPEKSNPWSTDNINKDALTAGNNIPSKPGRNDYITSGDVFDFWGSIAGRAAGTVVGGPVGGSVGDAIGGQAGRALGDSLEGRGGAGDSDKW